MLGMQLDGRYEELLESEMPIIYHVMIYSSVGS